MPVNMKEVELRANFQRKLFAGKKLDMGVFPEESLVAVTTGS